MTLNEFVNEMYETIDEFEEHWKDGEKRSGQGVFPDEMGEEEWAEQFEAWWETRNL